MQLFCSSEEVEAPSFQVLCVTLTMHCHVRVVQHTCNKSCFMFLLLHSLFSCWGPMTPLSPSFNLLAELWVEKIHSLIYHFAWAWPSKYFLSTLCLGVANFFVRNKIESRPIVVDSMRCQPIANDWSVTWPNFTAPDWRATPCFDANQSDPFGFVGKRSIKRNSDLYADMLALPDRPSQKKAEVLEKCQNSGY